jgi:sirohydrochlorin cobaltochelatase
MAEGNALILFAHGSRDPQWAEPFRAVRDKVIASRPGADVELAFLEIMQPSLAEAVDRLVARGHRRLTIAPLFMAQGAHLKRDLAGLAADAKARHAGIEIVLLPAAGAAEPVLDAMSTWLAGHV